MKKHLAPLFVALLLASSSSARADGEGEPNSPNLLLINVGALLNGVVQLEYERALNSFFGIDFGLSVSTFRGVFAPTGSASVVAFGPEVGVRFHFIRDAPGGLWIGPSISGAYVAASSNGTVVRAFGWGVNAAIGYNFFFGRHFALQLGIGGGFVEYGYGFEWAPHFRVGLGGRF